MAEKVSEKQEIILCSPAIREAAILEFNNECKKLAPSLDISSAKDNLASALKFAGVVHEASEDVDITLPAANLTDDNDDDYLLETDTADDMIPKDTHLKEQAHKKKEENDEFWEKINFSIEVQELIEFLTIVYDQQQKLDEILRNITLEKYKDQEPKLEAATSQPALPAVALSQPEVAEKANKTIEKIDATIDDINIRYDTVIKAIERQFENWKVESKFGDAITSLADQSAQEYAKSFIVPDQKNDDTIKQLKAIFENTVTPVDLIKRGIGETAFAEAKTAEKNSEAKNDGKQPHQAAKEVVTLMQNKCELMKQVKLFALARQANKTDKSFAAALSTVNKQESKDVLDTHKKAVNKISEPAQKFATEYLEARNQKNAAITELQNRKEQLETILGSSSPVDQKTATQVNQIAQHVDQIATNSGKSMPDVQVRPTK